MLPEAPGQMVEASGHPGPSIIAVAIPTYKRKELLARLIGSVPRRWQVFVSDNDSSLAPLESKFGEHVVVSHAPALIGMFANWNRALSLVDSRCTHVFVPSDDDLFLPEAEDTVDQALRHYPDADVFVFGCDFFDEQDRRWGGYAPSTFESLAPGEGFLRFVAGVEARMPGVLFRREFLTRIGAFDERLELTAADSELVQRALLLGRSVFIPKVIGLYRVWSGSLTHARQATDQWMEEVALWTDKIVTLLQKGHQPASRRIDVRRYRDEIIARNLLAGLENLLRKGEPEQARDFLRRHPTPMRASLRTRLQLLRRRLRIWRRTR